MSQATVSEPERTPRHADAKLRHEAMQLGMWVLLAGEVLFFGVLVAAYALARWHGPEGFAAASAKTDLLLGTLNTAVLLSSSFAMALAAHASQESATQRATPWLWTAGGLGVLFIVIKAFEWHAEWAEHLLPGAGFALADKPGAELFFAWYFTATALHAVHLLIGIVVTFAFAIASRSRFADEVGAPRIPALALYWHFVDAVWVLLYPLIYLVAPR